MRKLAQALNLSQVRIWMDGWTWMDVDAGWIFLLQESCVLRAKACKLDINASGSLDINDNLTFFWDGAQPRVLGASDLGQRQSGTTPEATPGWFYRVEIFGEIGPEEPFGWEIRQTKSVFFHQEVKDASGNIIVLPDVRLNNAPDGPEPEFYQFGPVLADGNLAVFSIDGPGQSLTDSDGRLIWNEHVIENFDDELYTPGAIQCGDGLRWHVEVTVKEGVGQITFGKGWLPLP